MAETLDLALKGLWTSPNPFSAVPQGALFIADNVVIDQDSLGQTRRGQKQYSLFANILKKIFQYQETLIANSADILSYDSDGNGTFVAYSGSFDAPPNANRMRSFESNKNFYLTTSQGIRKLDSITGSFVAAGAPVGLGGTASLENPGFLAIDTQVAYRMVWGYTDANDNEIVGAPSQRLIVANNTLASANVSLTWQIPSGPTTSWFYRIYRSGPSADLNSPPDDELQQVLEGNPTSGEISAGTFTVLDDIPDSLRGAFLYTDPSQEGINQANDQPPMATDVALFRNCAFYFNTVSKNRYFLSLLAVGDNTLGGSFGYQTNNGTTHTNTTIDGLTKAASVVIQDLTYTADAAGVDGNNIAITYVTGGTAGSEVVTVTDNNINVRIQSAVSTATQIKAAIDAVPAAAALVNITISGTGSNTQVLQAETFLEDGFDTTYLNVGMRVVGTGVQSGTLIVSIDSSSAITVTPATTASATVAMEFQDVFRIDTLAYYATTATNVGNHAFKVWLDGTPGENIQNTCAELIKVVNQDTTNTEVYMFYLSGPEDLPGLMMIQERSIGSAAFAVTSTNGDSFSPTLSNTGTNNISTNDAKQNRAYISKPMQPEAVPVLQYLAVGSENFPILRGIALRESVFVLKDDGIYKITGNDISSFQVTLFDSSARLRAPETAVVLNNQIYCYSDQGIITISETGVQIISRPIEATLLEITSPEFTFFEENAFAIAYESDRKYLFFCMDEHDDVYPTQAFVYNTITNTFTRWPLERSCGLVAVSDNKLYSGNPDDLYMYKERKNFDRTDYADNEFAVVIVSSDDYEITIDDTTGISEGDLIKQDGLEAIVESVDDATTLTVDYINEWSAGAATVYQAINATIQWVPNTSSNPGVLKHFSECTLFFKDASFNEINLGFQTSFDDSFDTVSLTPGASQGWGLFPWGERPWGVGGGRPLPIRTYVTLEKQRASWINFKVNCNEAFSSFMLTGISTQYEDMGSRFR